MPARVQSSFSKKLDQKAKESLRTNLSPRIIVMPHPTGPTDPNTKALIRTLEKKKGKFYSDVARYLERPARSKGPVNVTKIGKSASENDTVAVPGKVLGSGEIRKSVTVYALHFSTEATRKIVKAGGKCLPLAKLDKKARIVI